MTHTMKTVFTTLSVLFLLTNTALADDPARTLVEEKYQQIQKIIDTDKSDQGVRSKVVDVLESFTDFQVFGKLTTFLSWFRQLIHRSYVRRFKANKEFNHEFRGVTQVKGDKAFVRTIIRTDKTEADVDYKLVLNTGSHKAYDIIIDDVSLMRNYRKQFRNVVKKHCGKKELCKKGFDDLMQRIKEKVASKGDDSGDL